MTDQECAAMENNGVVCLSYTDFLAASCKKRWSFVDAIYGVMPIFGMVTKSSPQTRPGLDLLKERALQIISTQVSDEINIARLIMLAEQQRIDNFEILLPYTLSEAQLQAIHREYTRPLTLRQHDDRLSVKVLAAAHEVLSATVRPELEKPQQ